MSWIWEKFCSAIKKVQEATINKFYVVLFVPGCSNLIRGNDLYEQTFRKKWKSSMDN